MRKETLQSALASDQPPRNLETERWWDMLKDRSVSCHMDVKWCWGLKGEPIGKDGEDVAVVWVE